jgi:hypothetical protein
MSTALAQVKEHCSLHILILRSLLAGISRECVSRRREYCGLRQNKERLTNCCPRCIHRSRAPCYLESSGEKGKSRHARATNGTPGKSDRSPAKARCGAHWSAALASWTGLLSGNFGAFFAGLGKTNGDSLLAAGDRSAFPALP